MSYSEKAGVATQVFEFDPYFNQIEELVNILVAAHNCAQDWVKLSTKHYGEKEKIIWRDLPVREYIHLCLKVYAFINLRQYRTRLTGKTKGDPKTDHHFDTIQELAKELVIPRRFLAIFKEFCTPIQEANDIYVPYFRRNRKPIFGEYNVDLRTVRNKITMYHKQLGYECANIETQRIEPQFAQFPDHNSSSNPYERSFWGFKESEYGQHAGNIKKERMDRISMFSIIEFKPNETDQEK